MEGGNAICDVLYGDITPSGKLTDTIAYQYTDYPSASTFNTSPLFVNYAEDIFVGYRCIAPYIDKSGILTSAKADIKRRSVKYP